MTVEWLFGRRFLVVEDEYIIATILEDYLAEIGCQAAWSADSVSQALQVIENETNIDGAILDMNLNGEAVGPVAAALADRRIPFCFMTGYGNPSEAGYPDAPFISKPFDVQSLRKIVSQLMAPAA